MHADTIDRHQEMKNMADELVVHWTGTEPMTSKSQVEEAIRKLKVHDGKEELLAEMLPYVVDACRAAGLLVKPSWRTLSLWSDEGWEGPATYELADKNVKGLIVEALAEFKAEGSMSGVWMADPGSTPESQETASYEGPENDEVDWTGFEWNTEPQ